MPCARRSLSWAAWSLLRWARSFPREKGRYKSTSTSVTTRWGCRARWKASGFHPSGRATLCWRPGTRWEWWVSSAPSTSPWRCTAGIAPLLSSVGTPWCGRGPAPRHCAALRSPRFWPRSLRPTIFLAPPVRW
uniref:Uncharacterized protein n=1 Tax=Ixodes ricinus TaxID=34613 RepID=A0A6B0US44_IXORI